MKPLVLIVEDEQAQVELQEVDHLAAEHPVDQVAPRAGQDQAQRHRGQAVARLDLAVERRDQPERHQRQADEHPDGQVL